MSALRSGPPDSVAGFTLTELIMVLAVVAIISAIALPRMGNAPILVSMQAEHMEVIQVAQSLGL